MVFGNPQQLGDETPYFGDGCIFMGIQMNPPKSHTPPPPPEKRRPDLRDS